jgi:hypothetical protein
MRTSFNIVDIIYKELYAAISGAITGKVYKNSRPVNSNKEDVVVGSLPINAEQIQRAVVNVNIHVPNLQVSIGGQQDSQADTARLSQLTTMVIGVLKDKVYNDYWFDIQQQNLFKDETTGDHYSNIRIDFYSENF